MSVKIIKRKLSTDTTFNPPHREKIILKLMQDQKANGYIRTSKFTSEIIWNRHSFRFAMDKKNGDFRKGLFLFNLVRRDVRAYLAKHKKKIRLPKKYPVNVENIDFKFNGDRICGTDLDHAYWKIAFNAGFISQKTYALGLNPKFKMIRLAALSTLGAPREYRRIIKGEITGYIVKKEGEPALQDVYRFIRYKCYHYMHNARVLLGDDFFAYRTDCIYYRDTKENKEKVRGYFKSMNMEYKQLFNVTRRKLMENKNPSPQDERI